MAPDSQDMVAPMRMLKTPTKAMTSAWRMECWLVCWYRCTSSSGTAASVAWMLPCMINHVVARRRGNARRGGGGGGGGAVGFIVV